MPLEGREGAVELIVYAAEKRAVYTGTMRCYSGKGDPAISPILTIVKTARMIFK
jgi:hypothetical protein